MFKKHSMQIKMVKDESALETERRLRTPEELEAINEMLVRDNLKFAAIAVASTATVLTVLKTASTLAINNLSK